jgi:class 3 adenylate cyclase/tetratricopeptide (TPR) repeat protein
MPFCISCGQENPDVAKFCLACGTPMAAAPAPAPVETRTEERRLVTAVFTDIVGSTATAEQLDPEDVRARLVPYYAEARRELELHGGSVAKFIGDAVVALFGAPIAHEDDPERAVRAAFAVTRAIEQLNASDDWLDLNIRTGVNTGDAIVVVGTNPGEEIGEAAGDVMNTAARIQGAAPINGIVVGELTYEATNHAIEYEEGEPVEAKGKAEPVRVWVAKEAKEHATRRVSRHGPLVGRDAELQKLIDLWEQVQRERLPGRATVTGAPGIGKSRLIEEVGARVDQDGLTVWGRCLPYGEGITYWAVTEILKGAAGILQSEGPEQISKKLGALLEEIGEGKLDELRTMAAAASNILGVATTPRGTYSATEIMQAELHWGIRRILQLLARRRPLMLVFEDLHWAEPTLIELVRYIAEDEPDVPILIVGSARPELAESMPALMRERERQVAVELEPLGSEIGRALLAELLSEEALKDTDAVDSLLKSTGGNPLFFEETVRMLMDRGIVDENGWHREEGQALPIPNSLQSLIGSRLDQLVPPERRVAQHASVVGSVFWPGAVAHLQSEHGTGHDAQLDQRLEVLERRDLIRQHEDSSVAGEREYAFKHILIRDVAYGRMPRGRRAQLHLRFADWTEGLSAAADEFVEIVGYHLEQACLLTRAIARATIEPPIDRAVHALSRAGEKAEAHEGMREADRFYARALDLLDDKAEQAIVLRLRRANTLIVLGQAQKGLDLLRPIVEQARAAGRLDLTCEALMYLAQIDHRQGRGTEAVERLDEALRLAIQAADRRLQIRSAFALASARGDVGELDLALEELRGAISIAEEIEDRPLRTVGHLRVGFLLFSKGDLWGAESQLERCTALAAELGSHRDEARAAFLLALIKYYRGEVDEAERLGEQARAWLERTGETFFQIQNLIALAQYALAKDELLLAEQHLRNALPTALEEGALEVVDIYRLLTEALCRQGRLADAAELAEFAGRDVPEDNPYASAAQQLAEACVAVASGDLARATERYEEAIGLLEQLELAIEVSQARLAYGRALRELGDASRAREQLELARAASISMGATGLAAEVDRELALVGAVRS